MTVPIAAVCRSPFTHVEGALAGWHPVDLTAAVMNALVDRAGIEPATVDEVWVGCAEPVGAQGADMARAAVLAAGWPERTGGTVVDRAETSGMAALHAAAAAIEQGTVRCAVVVGVGHASTVAPGASALGRTYGRPWGDGPATRVADDGGLLSAPASADRAARHAGIPRSAQEDWATGSYERRGLFAPASITKVDAQPGDRVAVQRGTPVDRDDLRRVPDVVADLPPAFEPECGTVTGFTFAPAADGVAAVLLCPHPDPVAELVGVGRSAGDPLDPIGNVAQAVALSMADRVGSPGELDRWELTEPTAAATLLAISSLGLDPDRVNVHGGTLGVGDAGAAEELRLIVDSATNLEPGHLLGTASMGPSGAAATLVQRP